ncbi:hypothetical protein PV10_07167 [Exophiala mesophila]|uniref:Uncharacterized protein n=1 Tax=Exophiala mesophila TaxID=212818 RepID=A0A0D1Z4R3_EXOME|nr:uncharacterized protein PV10_07167 [Exophiala mesophila]KIV89792.1 hypothetical protein PV10_07167 [Exophiala mesophila]
MDPISISSGIAGLITLGLQVSATLAIYINAIRERDNSIKELRDELILLGEVLSQLRDFLTTDEVRSQSFDQDSVLRNAIRTCYQRIERIGDKIKVTDGGKMARVLEKLKWPFEQREVNHMVETLRSFSQTFQFALSIQGCHLLSKTADSASKSLQELHDMSKKMEAFSSSSVIVTNQLQQILTLLPMLSETVDQVNELTQTARLAEMREQERRTSDILDWLAPVSALHKHRDMQAKQAPGTGKWFLQMPQFLQWIQDGSAQHDLLCVGGPGAGKSVLASIIIDHLKAHAKDTDIAVAYYYYDYSEQQSQHPSNLARSLLRQLCTRHRNLPIAVADFYQRTRNDVKDQTWFHDLLSILCRIILTYDQCFIVIDALDEADNLTQRTGFFQVLNTIRNVAANIKVLATSRPHILRNGGKFKNPVVVDVVANPHDLRQFLEQAIEAHSDPDDRLEPEFKEQIMSSLCASSNGLFLLPALQIRIIMDQTSKSEMKRALHNASKTLTAAFQSTMQRINRLSETRKDLALRSLMWISHARRPMSMVELQHALATRPDDVDLDRDNMTSPRTLLDCCCGLIEVDRDNSIVRLVHHSLEEYLRDYSHGLFKDADMLITRTCLKYLSFHSIDQLPSKHRSEFNAAIANLSFIEYASAEWGHHAHDVSAEAIKDLALPFLLNPPALFTMTRVRESRTPDFRKFIGKSWSWAKSGGAGISVCAEFGLVDMLQILIEEQGNDLCLDSRNSYGSTPLHEAAMNGHVATAKVLIEHGSSVLWTNYGHSTPLYLAVTFGQTAMIKFLLEHGRTQLDLKGPNDFTPLHKAVEQGNEEMVALFLEAGALLASTDKQGNTPLHLAAKRGYKSIAKSLVEAGAFVHVKDHDQLCPLDHAATGGFADLVEFFANNGGSIGHKGKEKWTSLHRAARGGHFQTVSLLLDRGADVIAEDFKGNIPLHLAARSGNMETVKMLLERRPNLKSVQLFSKDRKHSTPREVAFFTAHYDIHKYLRAAEWEVVGGERSRSSLLTTAIERGEVNKVREILTKQPESIDQVDEDGQPPLHVAIQERQTSIIHLLLKYGASVERSGYHGWRALHIAASLGDLDLVNICLAQKADVSARTDTSQTALHKAASAASLDVIRRLIEAGSDINARNNRGMTALHIAAHQNRTQVARSLVLDYGMDVLARDRQGLTPVMWAERSGHFEVRSFLKKMQKLAAGNRGVAVPTQVPVVGSVAATDDGLDGLDHDMHGLEVVA